MPPGRELGERCCIGRPIEDVVPHGGLTGGPTQCRGPNQHHPLPSPPPSLPLLILLAPFTPYPPYPPTSFTCSLLPLPPRNAPDGGPRDDASEVTTRAAGGELHGARLHDVIFNLCQVTQHVSMLACYPAPMYAPRSDGACSWAHLARPTSATLHLHSSSPQGWTRAGPQGRSVNQKNNADKTNSHLEYESTPSSQSLIMRSADHGGEHYLRGVAWH